MHEKNTREHVVYAQMSAGQAPILVTAGLSAAFLLVAVGWQLGEEVRSERVRADALAYMRETSEEVVEQKRPESTRDWQSELALLGLISTSTDSNTATATSSMPYIGDVIADQFLSGYISLKESGRYTQARGKQLGEHIGSNVRAPIEFVQHGESELTKTTDTSVERALSYRSDMRDALEGLINNAPAEFESFGYYIETKNPERLRELEESAARYRAAEASVLKVIVPQDAALVHLRVVNSMGAFAASLDVLIRYADDPLATIASVRTYNEAESEMLYAFDALASYYVRKIQSK